MNTNTTSHTKPLSQFEVGEIFITGPGDGLIGTKTEPEKVRELLTGGEIFVPKNRLGRGLDIPAIETLKKTFAWRQAIQQS